MAINGTNVTIVGNCTRDPELRFTNAGMAVVNFGVATNFRKMNRQTNEWEEEEPTFYNVSAFQQLAENAAETLTKGSRVLVVGRLRQRSYTTQDGETRSSLEIVADDLGPSLRFATAQVQRTERQGGGFDGGSGGGRPAPATGGGGGDFYDEEPF